MGTVLVLARPRRRGLSILVAAAASWITMRPGPPARPRLEPACALRGWHVPPPTWRPCDAYEQGCGSPPRQLGRDLAHLATDR